MKFDTDDFCTRLEALERKNRRLRLALSTLALCFVATIAMGQAGVPRYDKIEVREIKILDQEDTTRAILKASMITLKGATEDAPKTQITSNGMYVRQGQRILSMSMLGDLSMISASDKTGLPRVQIYAREKDTFLQLNGKDIDDEIHLWVHPGAPRINVKQGGRTRPVIPAD